MTDQPAKDDYADSLEAALISDMVSGGETVVAACRTLGVSVNTTYGRLGRSERFREMMEKAREAGFDVIAENVRRVTRGEAGHSSGDVKRDRLIVETDMKLLAKWHPHRYGEKLQIEQKSATVAIPTSDDPIAAQRAYEQLISGKG